ncbi:hypothetical protein BDQ12DRAFT_672085 [Crucibulum laeve]|uniref:Uncharacterized protein n=1 Tax=Crucibulum laeve TaxID=68775 RepID=A0A5C3LR15_9AGAR|nr:hypothetical protein BDQ12DRAFT_672085 [Crucibulum laeve]
MTLLPELEPQSSSWALSSQGDTLSSTPANMQTDPSTLGLNSGSSILEGSDIQPDTGLELSENENELNDINLSGNSKQVKKRGRPRIKPLPDLSIPKCRPGRPCKEPELLLQRKSFIPPPLHNPDAPRGKSYNSVLAWREKSGNGNSSYMQINTSVIQEEQVVNQDILEESILREPQVRQIIPDIGESAQNIIDDDNDNDDNDLGTEEFHLSIGDIEHNNDEDALDPSLKNLDDEAPLKSGKKNQWLLNGLLYMSQALKIIQKKDKNGKLSFYNDVQDFWVPKKAKWFQMMHSQTLGPETLYEPRVFYWDPQLLVDIKCPSCKQIIKDMVATFHVLSGSVTYMISLLNLIYLGLINILQCSVLEFVL